MTYQVLARKWRPKNFAELVGQTHVMQALSNALEQQRVHHAYLFTGTRGVGKTTIARIFAKALNCEHGPTPNPCGQCSACQAIDQGRFVDLIEVDAASRTKVEDTREILDNVQYSPTQGRFKVYLIDEVHMLSKSSFNALLKTLEEPPAHVKFLLATTEPHKLPITVLSRCLQFNLLRLTTTQLEHHLAHILNAEQIDFEPGALALIAKAADGSARDALSLLDQSIAYCAGRVTQDAVQAMLGLVNPQLVQTLLAVLQTADLAGLKQLFIDLSALGVDYLALLNQLLASFHQLAQTQFFGEALDIGDLNQSQLGDLAERIDPAKLQVWYQIGLIAQQDIRLAPDTRMGFEMTLLRMFAFKPNITQQVSSKQQAPGAPVSSGAPTVSNVSTESSIERPSQLRQGVKPPAPVHQVQDASPSLELDAFPALKARVERAQLRQVSQEVSNKDAPLQEQAAETSPTRLDPVQVDPVDHSTSMVNPAASVPQHPIAEPSKDSSTDLASWMTMIEQLQPTGMTLALAQQACWVQRDDQAWWLALDAIQLQANNTVAWQNLQKLVHEKVSDKITLHKCPDAWTGMTPMQLLQQNKQAQETDWTDALMKEPLVANIEATLGMTRLPNSVKVNYHSS